MIKKLRMRDPLGPGPGHEGFHVIRVRSFVSPRTVPRWVPVSLRLAPATALQGRTLVFCTWGNRNNRARRLRRNLRERAFAVSLPSAGRMKALSFPSRLHQRVEWRGSFTYSNALGAGAKSMGSASPSTRETCAALNVMKNKDLKMGALRFRT